MAEYVLLWRFVVNSSIVNDFAAIFATDLIARVRRPLSREISS